MSFTSLWIVFFLFFSLLNSSLQAKVFYHSTLVVITKAESFGGENEAETTEIQAKEDEIASVEKKKNASQFALVLSLIVVIILALFTVTLYKNNRMRKSANALLLQKNKELISAQEKMQEASKIKENFFNTITHELRTPIYAITGSTYLLLKEKPREDQKEHLNALNYSGEHLLSLINNILDINKIAANEIVIVEREFNFHKRIHSLFNSFKEMAKSNNVSLHLELDENIPERLKGDILKISQVLMNLISNAIKYSDDQSVWLTAKLVAAKEAEVDVYFEVRDTGIGIEKSNFEKVFQDFYQGENEYNQKYGGTGLGLAIVKRLLEILGSEIYFESELFEGSRFYFTINLKTVENTEEEVVPQKKTAPYSDKILKDKNVLVVEDNKLNQRITQKILERKEALVKIVENGQQAVDIMKEQRFDLILMDIHMPVKNGIEATQEIREFNRQTPIIALTAVTLEHKDEEYYDIGFDAVISKPYNTDFFYKKITDIIANSGNQE
ncbi:hybrid sensor histidine kinase/response regulator [Mesonia sp. K7]|nr:hybrid sensor histidine kinase/response regulator [Mesonia sp. K7]